MNSVVTAVLLIVLKLAAIAAAFGFAILAVIVLVGFALKVLFDKLEL